MVADSAVWVLVPNMDIMELESLEDLENLEGIMMVKEDLVVPAASDSKLRNYISA